MLELNTGGEPYIIDQTKIKTISCQEIYKKLFGKLIFSLGWLVDNTIKENIYLYWFDSVNFASFFQQLER